MTQMISKRLLSTGEVREITGWSKSKIRTLCETGRLPAINTSTTARPRWEVRECDLEIFCTPVAIAKTQERQTKPRRRIDEGVKRVFG